MVKCMSSVTPRYLADREKRTVKFPTVRESGRGIEFEILVADMISASVLSQFVVGHPQLHVMDALLHGLNELINLLWRGRFLQLSVISKRMMKDRVAVHNIRERCGIQNEENRSLDRSLWDSTADGHWGRATVVYSHSLVLFVR